MRNLLLKTAVLCLLPLSAPAAFFESLQAEKQAQDALEKFDSGRPEEASVLLEKARSNGADEARTSYNLGVAASIQENSNTAIMEYERAIRAAEGRGDPLLLASAWYNLGVELARRNKLEAALEAFRSSIRFDPSSEDARFNHELIRRLLEKTKKQAQHRKEQEEKLRNKLEELLKRLAELLIRQGQTIASLWSAFPETAPAEEQNPGSPETPPVSSNGMKAIGERLINALKNSLPGSPALNEGLPPLKPGMSSKEVAAWVRKAFHPRPARPAGELAESEREVASGSADLKKDFNKLASTLQPPNPMAAALKEAAENLGKAFAEAGKAAAFIAAPAVPAEKASQSAVEAERALISALLCFLKPPQKQQSDEKKQQDQQQKQQQDQQQQKQQQDQQQQKRDRQQQQGKRQEEGKKDAGRDTHQQQAKERRAQPMTKEEAERLLEALRKQDDEALKELLRRRAIMQQGRPSEVEKDW